MNTRYAIWLNNLALHDLDERIILTDVQENAPRMNTATVSNACYDGLRVIRRTRQSLSVTVSFLIREYDPARRQALCSDVCAWAASGGWLTLNTRPGQRLRVTCETLPTVSSALRWTEPLTLVFTAWEMPYWQEEHPLSYPLHLTPDAPARIQLLPRGAAPCCFVEGTFRNLSSMPVRRLTITADDSMFDLAHENLIPIGEMLTIGYDRHGMLLIRSGKTSMLHARSAKSSDDLLLTPGKAGTITVAADQPLQATLQARGLYL